MDKLSRIEQENQISLPEIYKDFYKLCSFNIPTKLVGTDLRNAHPELNQWAIELLEEDGIENFLDDNDFVFMMHQGYMFWYFKADGNPDPIVYGYHENKLKPDNLGLLSEFIREYLSCSFHSWGSENPALYKRPHAKVFAPMLEIIIFTKNEYFVLYRLPLVLTELA
jgi:hypothetical protein